MVLLARWQLWRTLGKEAGTKSVPHSSTKVSQEVRKFLLKWENPEDCARPQIPGAGAGERGFQWIPLGSHQLSAARLLSEVGAEQWQTLRLRGRSHALCGKTAFPLGEGEPDTPRRKGGARP